MGILASAQRWERMRKCCSTALSMVVLLLISRPALGQWDPERIAAVKQSAEAAYEAEDYAGAARDYIELRGVLKSALDAGEVPDIYIDSVKGALVACEYQLGRSNQLTGNCKGAVSVFSDMLSDGYASPEMIDRGRLRLAESHACLATQASLDGRFDESAMELALSREVFAKLEQELVEPSESFGASVTEVRALLEDAEGDVAVAYVAETEVAVERSQCEVAKDYLEGASARGFELSSVASRWSQVNDAYQVECVLPKPEPPPKVVDEESSIGPWVLMGVGAGTLIGAVVFDMALVGELDEYDEVLAQCEARVVGTCEDAHDRYDSLQGKPEIAFGLYLGGGVLLAGGVIWAVMDRMNEDAETSVSQVQIQISPDQIGGAWSLRF